MADIKTFDNNPIVVDTGQIADGAVTDKKLAQSNNILSTVHGIENNTGVFHGALTGSGQFPYIDVPVNVKSGDWVCTKIESYSGDESNFSHWYLYDPSTSSAITSSLSKTGYNVFKATADISTVRVIFKQFSSFSYVINVSVSLFSFGDESLKDVSTKLLTQEYEFAVSSSSDLSKSGLGTYVEKGDYIELEVVDDEGVLASNYYVAFGLKHGSTNVDDVLTLTAPFNKGIAQVGTDVDPCSLRVFIYARHIQSSGTLKIKFRNLTQLGIDVQPKHYGSFGILGDSYSTFAGYTNPTTNRQWYPTTDPTAQGYESGNDVTSVFDTWWQQVAANTDMYMAVNASYSGSTVCYDSYGSGSDDGKETSFIQRVDDLEKCNVVFIFGGTNDYWAGAGIGDYKYSEWTESDLSYFAPGLAYLIDQIRRKYIGTDIVFIENDLLSSAYKTAIETVCGHYSVPVIKLANVSKVSGHPDIAGMKSIADQVRHFLAYNYSLPQHM